LRPCGDAAGPAPGCAARDFLSSTVASAGVSADLPSFASATVAPAASRDYDAGTPTAVKRGYGFDLRAGIGQGLNADATFHTGMPTRCKSSTASIEKLRGTGFTPACDLDAALAATAKWFAGR